MRHRGDEIGHGLRGAEKRRRCEVAPLVKNGPATFLSLLRTGGHGQARAMVTVTITAFAAGRVDCFVPCLTSGGVNSEPTAPGLPAIGIPLRIGVVVAGPRVAFNQPEVHLQAWPYMLRATTGSRNHRPNAARVCG